MDFATVLKFLGTSYLGFTRRLVVLLSVTFLVQTEVINDLFLTDTFTVKPKEHVDSITPMSPEGQSALHLTCCFVNSAGSLQKDVYLQTLSPGY